MCIHIERDLLLWDESVIIHINKYIKSEEA